MSQACSGGSDGGATRRNTAALMATDRLAFAASPTFAVMALLTGALGGSRPEVLCLAAQDALPLTGMVTMYLLMCGFHSAPWLRLICGRRSRAHRS